MCLYSVIPVDRQIGLCAHSFRFRCLHQIGRSSAASRRSPSVYVNREVGVVHARMECSKFQFKSVDSCGAVVVSVVMN